jgi:hypothetical protein
VSDVRVIGEEEIQQTVDAIYSLVKRAWGNAAAVKIFVNAEGITVEPRIRSEISGFTMRNIGGDWIKKGRNP